MEKGKGIVMGLTGIKCMRSRRKIGRGKSVKKVDNLKLFKLIKPKIKRADRHINILIRTITNIYKISIYNKT